MSKKNSPPEEPRGYTPPAHLEAEQSVLGAILVRPEVLDELIDQVYEEDFYREGHAKIYHAMVDLHGANFPVDLVTVSAYLKDRNQLDACGGPVFLAQLSEQVGFATNAAYYAKLVREKAILRRLLDASQEIAGACLSPVENVEELVGQAEIKISGAMEDRGTREYSLAELVPEETKRIEILHEHRDQLLGVATGFRGLDQITAGFQKSDLIILAARPGTGKTSLALNIAHYAATKATPVAFFSLEMAKEQLVQKLIASEGRIDADRLRTGRMTGDEWAKLYAIQGLLEKVPLYIRDDASPTVLQIKAQARRMKKKYGIGLVVVDYLQLMRDPRERVREQQIARISSDLKAMAKELDVPVLALSQLNRELEKRPNRRPKLADLRESGAIEQDADVVMFIYRDEEYRKDSPDKGIAEIEVAKQRKGRTGLVKLAYQGQFTRFSNYYAPSEGG
jgi:replicative DNA helicase